MYLPATSATCGGHRGSGRNLQFDSYLGADLVNQTGIAMTYTVKEIFLTQQGEGANIGKTAVFIRFAGCNLWSGREADRARAVCKFCDTDFVGGTRYSAAEMADLAVALWPGEWRRFCVLTGGEPLLQVDAALVKELRSRRFSVAIETNGTRPLPCNVDWVCVSPKAGVPLVLRDADELKLVYPQAGISPDDLTEFSAVHRWLSPMDAPRRKQANTKAAAIYCRAHPEWRLAIQAHKTWNIP
jgi:7-carboxy-7-deazaguanine synthase